MERAVPKRRYELAAGRRLARRLLGAKRSIGATDRRAPIWPAGVFGSIAHAGQVCVVVVTEEARSVGVDVEPYTPLAERTEGVVLRDEERAALPHDASRGLLAKRIFCAKEAFFKAQWPLTEAWIGFRAARVTLDGARFVIEVVDEIPPAAAGRHEGFFEEVEGYVFAGIVLTDRLHGRPILGTVDAS